MPNLHVLFLQVVIGLVAISEAAPCRHHAHGARNDAVSFHQHQARVDNSYLDAAAPPSLGFNTERMERWEDRDFVDKEMEQELERWYKQWGGSYDNDDNSNNEYDYDGDDEDNDFDPYPATTYNHRRRLLGKRSTALTAREAFETLYPYTTSLFHPGSDVPSPSPPTRQFTYPPPRPLSAVPGAVIASALSPFADTLTSPQAAALTSLHKQHVAQFAALNSKFRKEVAATKEKDAKTIADILGVPVVEAGKSGKPRHVDLDKLNVQQTTELAIYASFVEHKFRAMFQSQMGERVGLLRRQRGEWEGLQRELGVKVVVEGQQEEGEEDKQKNLYWGGLDQGEVSWYGEWLEKRSEGEEEGGKEIEEIE